MDGLVRVAEGILVWSCKVWQISSVTVVVCALLVIGFSKFRDLRCVFTKYSEARNLREKLLKQSALVEDEGAEHGAPAGS